MNKNLKNLLKTSTILAGVAFGAMEAGAATRDVDNANVLAIAGWGAGDDIKFVDSRDLNVNADVLAIDLGDQDLNDKTITVLDDFTIGSIGLDGANLGDSAKKALLKVVDGKTLTLDGAAGGAVVANTYTGLGNITLGNALAPAPGADPADNGESATLIITADGATFNGTINSGDDNGANKLGILEVKSNATFKGNIGNTNALKELKIATAAGVVTIGSTAGAQVLKAKDIMVGDGGGNNFGLTFTGGAGAEVEGTITGNADGGNTATITIDDAVTLKGDIAGDAQTKVIINDAKTLTIDSAGAARTIGVVVDNAAGGGNTGKLKISGDNHVNFNEAIGRANPLAEIDVNLDPNKLVTFGVEVKATGLKLTRGNASFDDTFAGGINFHADGEIKFEDNAEIDGAVDNLTAVDNLGTLVFVGDSNVTGKIGNAKSLKLIKLLGNDAQTVKFEEDVKAAAINIENDAKITLENGKTITAAIKNTNPAGNKGAIEFAGVGHVVGNIGEANKALRLIKVIDNNQVTLNGAVFAQTIENSFDNRGKIDFQGAATITGKIGVSGGNNTLSEIKTGAGLVTFGVVGADSEVKVTELKLTNAASAIALNSSKITGKVDNTSGAANATKITVAGASEIIGRVGETAAINTVEIGDGSLKLGGASHKIGNVLLNKANSTLTLGANNWKITGANIKAAMAGEGKIVISGDSDGDSEIEAIGENGTNIGEINFTAAKSFTYAGADLFVNKITTDTNGQGSIILKSPDGAKVTASIGTLGQANGALNIAAPANKFLAGVKFATADKTFSVDGRFIGAPLGFDDAAGANANTKLEIGRDDLQTITSADGVAAAITTTADNIGQVSVVGNALVIGDIGNNKLKALTFDKDNASLTAVHVDGSLVNIKSSGIAFNKAGSSLVLGGNAAHVIDSPISVDMDGYGSISVRALDLRVGNGTITSANAAARVGGGNGVKFTEAVGDKASSKAISLVDVQDGTVIFEKDANVTTINAGTVTLGTAGKLLTVGTIQQAGALAGNTAEVNLGASHAIKADKIIGRLSFNGAADAGVNASIVQEVQGDVSVAGTNTNDDSIKIKTITGNLTFAGAGGKLNILGGGLVTGDVKGDGANRGKLKIEGDATLNGKIENLQSITLAGADAKKLVTVKTDKIGTADLVQGASTLVLSKPTVLTGTYHPTNSTLNVGPHSFTAEGQTTVNGALTINVEYDADKINPATYFAADLKAGAGVDLTAVGSKIVVNIDTRKFKKSQAGTKVQFIKPGADLTDKFEIIDDRAVVLWEGDKDGFAHFTIDAEALNLTSEGKPIFTADEIKANPILSTVLDKDNYTYVSDDFYSIINDVKDEGTPDLLKEMVARISDVGSQTGAANVVTAGVNSFALTNSIANENVVNVSEVIATRVSGQEVEGVAAGDSAISKDRGLWAKALGGMSTQKSRKGAAGFKTKSMGALVGVDTMINDNASIGFVLGNNASNVKHRDLLSGGKTKTNSWIFGVYGSYNFENNWFVTGSGVGVQTAIDSKHPRIVAGDATKAIARAKYDVTNFGIGAAVGYGIKVGDASTVTPTVGVRWNHTNEIEYKETGPSAQNNSIKQKAMDTASLTADIRAATRVEMENGTNLAPFAHVGANYGLGTKTPRGTFINEGIPGQVNNFVGTKPAKLMTTIGVGVDASTDMLEYGVAYNANVSQKYLGHEGSIRVKVNF